LSAQFLLLSPLNPLCLTAPLALLDREVLRGGGPVRLR